MVKNSKILIQLLIDYVLLSAAFLTAIALKFEDVITSYPAIFG